MEEILFNTIDEAIEDIKLGKTVIVVDDEDRENEGDFICAAEAITPEIVNFMASQGRGLICAAITEERSRELELEMMVDHNTSSHNTAFTVSVDLIGQGCTTGISASDRSPDARRRSHPPVKFRSWSAPYKCQVPEVHVISVDIFYSSSGEVTERTED